jgi:DNA-binding NarL/FixJ family response regulator
MIRTDSSPLQVVVSHAEPLLAAGLVATLRQEPELRVTAQQQDSLPEGSDVQDRVVITDYENGLRVAAAARMGRSRTRVLVMTMLDRERDVHVALDTGVHGILRPDCSIEELRYSVHSVGRGFHYLYPEVARRLAASVTHESMTTRETEVLQLLAQGQCNKVIAQRLDVTLGTVKSHMRNILAKLNASNRTAAVRIASQRGLVRDERNEPLDQERPGATAVASPDWIAN